MNHVALLVADMKSRLADPGSTVGREPIGQQTMAFPRVSYNWIELDTPEAYDRLIDVLDPEFDPKAISDHLKSQVSDAAKGLLVEHGYVDKDYRSTFYNFYAKKGRHYRADCVRLHFFDGAVRYDDDRADVVCNDLRPQDHYFGYVVLRPTIVATLGRSVLSPNVRRGARGLAIQSRHHVNLLGRRLPIWGFPSMAQHVDIPVRDPRAAVRTQAVEERVQRPGTATLAGRDSRCKRPVIHSRARLFLSPFSVHDKFLN